jgi:hypothetical protein
MELFFELFLVWILYASFAVAAPTSTSPLSQGGQEHGKDDIGRGTLDIIESCLATIIACT